MKKLILAGVAAVFAISTVACSTTTGNNDYPHAKGSHHSKSAPKLNMTVSQKNALQSAKSYLSMGAFSHAGLVQQLSSKAGDGYSKADAIFAVNHTGADWNAEAVKAAKGYMSMSSFSRAGLIRQLSSPYGDQFTVAQATYAANHVGLR